MDLIAAILIKSRLGRDIPANFSGVPHVSTPEKERNSCPGSLRIYHIPGLSEGEVLRPLRFHECEVHTSGQVICLSSGGAHQNTQRI